MQDHGSERPTVVAPPGSASDCVALVSFPSASRSSRELQPPEETHACATFPLVSGEGATCDCSGLASASRDNLGFFDAYYLECYQAARRTLQSQKLPAGDPEGVALRTSESEEHNGRASMTMSQASASSIGTEAPLLPWCTYCREHGHHSPPGCRAFDADKEERRNLGLDYRCQFCGHFGHYERACVTPRNRCVHYCFRCKAWGHEQGYGCGAENAEENLPPGYWRDRPAGRRPPAWWEPCGRCGFAGHSRKFCTIVQCPYCKRWGSCCPAPRCLRK